MSPRADQKPPARFRWLKQPGRFARDTRAASAVEFALLALPLFALILAALQWAIVLMAEAELETATEKAARQVMTGQVSSNSSASNYVSQSNFQKTVCGYLVALFNCSNVMVNMQTASTWASASTSAPSYATLQQNSWSYTTGTVGQVIVLQVMYEWPIVSNVLGFNLANLSNGTRLLMATSVFQNEP